MSYPSDVDTEIDEDVRPPDDVIREQLIPSFVDIHDIDVNRFGQYINFGYHVDEIEDDLEDDIPVRKPRNYGLFDGVIPDQDFNLDEVLNQIANNEMEDALKESKLAYMSNLEEEYKKNMECYGLIKPFLKKMYVFDKENAGIYGELLEMIQMYETDAETEEYNKVIVDMEKYNSIVAILNNTRLTKEQIRKLEELMQVVT